MSAGRKKKATSKALDSKPYAKGGGRGLSGISRLGIALACGAVLFGGLVILLDGISRKSSDSFLVTATSAALPEGPCRSLEQLLSKSPTELAQLDIARINLLCAQGLPGAEQIDVEAYLATLDQWAQYVKKETDRHLYKYRLDPADYNNSPGYFRMLLMVTALQQDLDIHYNLERMRDVNFSDSQDLFVHGLLSERRSGTCISMPVLYVAIGRRLGYPLKLVTCNGHVFVRWDDPAGERFNVEATSRGLICRDDDYYKEWPHKITDADIKACNYLKSLSPAEELAEFLVTRGHCFAEIALYPQAQLAYCQARNLAPKSQQYLSFLGLAVQQELRKIKKNTNPTQAKGQ